MIVRKYIILYDVDISKHILAIFVLYFIDIGSVKLFSNQCMIKLFVNKNVIKGK